MQNLSIIIDTKKQNQQLPGKQLETPRSTNQNLEASDWGLKSDEKREICYATKQEKKF